MPSCLLASSLLLSVVVNKSREICRRILKPRMGEEEEKAGGNEMAIVATSLQTEATSSVLFRTTAEGTIRQHSREARGAISDAEMADSLNVLYRTIVRFKRVL